METPCLDKDGLARKEGVNCSAAHSVEGVGCRFGSFSRALLVMTMIGGRRMLSLAGLDNDRLARNKALRTVSGWMVLIAGVLHSCLVHHS
ncbi:hypothetical protein CBR_g47111 [Chara braunii]|uniref:Uncharacterized protein n=1 Tax=Chara braunii TaxID=69332 RepID=A0A388M1Q4_CHABU|nr:hypothetical protein CBR_g47111 [Chara braunii]|eukprot:GBG88412.1 hypothetical protein CBR_g47111 [Chara braunii]